MAEKLPSKTLYKSKRQRHEILRAQLTNEISSFISHWRTISRFIRPRRVRLDISDVNKGDRRNKEIIDSTASQSSRTLRAGMMAGVTSPARPWFRLSVGDPNLAENEEVKDWCHKVSDRMNTIFEKSNLYQALPIVYGDMGDFGTGCVLIEEDFDTVIRCYPFTVGSYMIALDQRLKVSVFFRQFRLTVRQVVEMFGQRDGAGEIDWSNFSIRIQNLYDNGQLEAWIDICHVIEPNPEFDPKRHESKFKKFSSCYYERGGSSSSSLDTGPMDPNVYLRESGYDSFRVLAPRWEVTDEGAYGTDCPGMMALGDVQQLQHGEKTGMQALDKMVKPSLQGGPEFANKAVSWLPGSVTVTTGREGAGLKPIHEVNLRLDLLENKQEQVRGRIKRAYMEDIFLAFTDSDRRQITATEITERKEEKLIAIGPTLSQLNQDLLDPLIDITFEIMLKQSQDAFGNYLPNAMIPQPPDVMNGQPLVVEYVSIMAQAQKLLGIASLERFSSFATSLAQAYPDAAERVDAGQMISVYADATGIASKIVRTDEQVAAIQQQKQQAAAQQQHLAAIQQGAGAAKDLSQTDTGGDNALTRLLGMANAGNPVPQR